MTVRKLFLLAIFGLWTAGAAVADDAAGKAQKENQKLANSVADKLRSSGVIKKGDGTKIGIEVREGVVDLSGPVASREQHSEIMQVISSVKGVEQIRSGMTGPGVGQAQEAAAMPPAAPAPTSYGQLQRTGGQGEGPLTGLPAPLGAAPGMPTGDPVPLNGAPMMSPLDPAGPRLPPHAWPTYAPYSNMSRVAYPQSYPYNAFPYIGPYYPFPKVPLGWRKVVLEWEDGHWYYGKLASPNDMWRVKFW